MLQEACTDQKKAKRSLILNTSSLEPANRDSCMTGEKGQLPQTTFCSQTETVKLQSQLSINLKHGIVPDNEKILN